jgi:hypothetical protein
MNSSESIDKLAQALVKAQMDMPTIPMDGNNPYFKSKYATLGNVISETRPVLAKHGLAITQMVISDEEGIAMGVKTVLVHESGQWIESGAKVRLGFEKNAPQEAGAIISYLRRYALSAILNVYADEDIDANNPDQQELKPQKGTHTPKKKETPDLETLISEYWAPLTAVADELGIKYDPLPDDITQGRFGELFLALQEKVENAQEEE